MLHIKAQLPLHTQYTIDDGLPSNTIYHILQDKKGYIWFATGTGASRFDGKTFVNYDLNDGLTDLDVLKIFEDSHGRIWFLSLNGSACYLKDDTIHNEYTNPELKELQMASGISSVAEDDKGTIFFSGIIGNIFSINIQNEIHKIERIEAGNAFLYTSKGQVYALCQSGNYRIEENQIHLLDSKYHPIGPDDAFYNKKNDTCYFYTPIGLAGFCNGESFLISPFKNSWARIRTLHFTSDGFHWVNTQTNGITKRTPDLSLEESETILQDYFVNYVMEDNEGSIWISTSGDGVLLLKGNHSKVKQIELTSGKSKQSVVTCLSSSKDGTIWAGTNSGEIFKINNSVSKRIQFKELKNPVYIASILNTQDGTYITDLDQTFFVPLNGLEIEFIPGINPANQLPNPCAFKTLFEWNDNVFGITYGLWHFDSTVRGFRYVKEDVITSQKINALWIDSDSTIWYNHADVLYSLKGNMLNSFEHLRHEFKGKITGIGRLADGLLAVSTYGKGLKFIKDNQIIKSLTTVDGLTSDVCRNMVIEGNTLYIATNNGLSIVTERNEQFTVRSLSARDQLPSNDIKCILIDENYIYAGSALGLIRINKDFEGISSSPPPLYIQSVILDKKIQSQNNLNIASDFASLVVRYAALSYDAQNAITYAYRFDDVENWIETKQTSLEFNRLNPGDYRLELRAKKFDSAWSEPVYLEFQIVPMWWQTTWFKFALVFVSILLSLALLSRYERIKHIKEQQEWKKQEAIDEERLRIAEDMHDDIGADLSNLLLVARIGKREALTGNPVDSNYQQIENITSQSLQKIDEIIWSLKSENDSLPELIQFIEKYFNEFVRNSSLQGNFKLLTEVKKIFLPTATRRNVYLVIKEALNNVAKHAKASEVNLTFTLETHKMILVLEDDGIGLLNNTNEQNGERSGLKNMASRIEKIGGHFSISSNHKNGTILTIILPVT